MWRTPAFSAASDERRLRLYHLQSGEEISKTRSTPESAFASVSGRSMSPSTASRQATPPKPVPSHDCPYQRFDRGMLASERRPDDSRTGEAVCTCNKNNHSSTFLPGN